MSYSSSLTCWLLFILFIGLSKGEHISEEILELITGSRADESVCTSNAQNCLDDNDHALILPNAITFEGVEPGTGSLEEYCCFKYESVYNDSVLNCAGKSSAQSHFTLLSFCPEGEDINIEDVVAGPGNPSGKVNLGVDKSTCYVGIKFDDECFGSEEDPCEFEVCVLYAMNEDSPSDPVCCADPGWYLVKSGKTFGFAEVEVPACNCPRNITCGDELTGNYVGGEEITVLVETELPGDMTFTVNVDCGGIVTICYDGMCTSDSLLIENLDAGVHEIIFFVTGDCSGDFEVITECETKDPTPAPTDNPTPAPTDNPTPAPTDNPTPAPTDNPTPAPTDNPTPAPTDNPTPAPTDNPTPAPTDNPTPAPTDNPTPAPTDNPTPAPTDNPTPAPTDNPTPAPTDNPTPAPTDNPTPAPTDNPTPAPTDNPTPAPTDNPTPAPTDNPTPAPTDNPTPAPTDNPTPAPTDNPTPAPTDNPTPAPTDNPTPAPTDNPTPAPTDNPTPAPTDNPTPAPTDNPTPAPTDNPTPAPTDNPTPAPTDNPTPAPTDNPTPAPTDNPTPAPTDNPTPAPTSHCDIIVEMYVNGDCLEAYQEDDTDVLYAELRVLEEGYEVPEGDIKSKPHGANAEHMVKFLQKHTCDNRDLLPDTPAPVTFAKSVGVEQMDLLSRIELNENPQNILFEYREMYYIISLVVVITYSLIITLMWCNQSKSKYGSVKSIRGIQTKMKNVDFESGTEISDNDNEIVHML